MIRYVVKATQTQNDAKEKVGVLNRVSKYIFAMREAYEGQKKGNRTRLRAVQLALLLTAVGLAAFFALRHHAW